MRKYVRKEEIFVLPNIITNSQSIIREHRLTTNVYLGHTLNQINEYLIQNSSFLSM